MYNLTAIIECLAALHKPRMTIIIEYFMVKFVLLHHASWNAKQKSNKCNIIMLYAVLLVV